MTSRYNSEGTRVATLDEMPYGFIPCKAKGCKNWFNRLNVTRKGYCHDHKHLVKEQSN